MPTITIEEHDDGSRFEANHNGGDLEEGALLLLTAEDGSERRVYRVISIRGDLVAVERELICTASFRPA
jgi:hypothetical protein